MTHPSQEALADILLARKGTAAPIGQSRETRRRRTGVPSAALWGLTIAVVALVVVLDRRTGGGLWPQIEPAPPKWYQLGRYVIYGDVANWRMDVRLIF